MLDEVNKTYAVDPQTLSIILLSNNKHTAFKKIVNFLLMRVGIFLVIIWLSNSTWADLNWWCVKKVSLEYKMFEEGSILSFLLYSVSPSEWIVRVIEVKAVVNGDAVLSNFPKHSVGVNRFLIALRNFDGSEGGGNNMVQVASCISSRY